MTGLTMTNIPAKFGEEVSGMEDVLIAHAQFTQQLSLIFLQ